MKKEELSDAIGKVDEDIIEEASEVREAASAGTAQQPDNKRRSPKKLVIALASAAAGLAAAAAAVIFVPKMIDAAKPAVYAPDITSAEVTGTADVTTAAQIPGPAVTETPDEASAKTLSSVISDRSRPVSDIISNVEAVSDSESTDSGIVKLRIDLLKETSEESLRERISFSPSGDYILEKETSVSYLLKSTVPIERGSLVKLTVSDEGGNICDSWAFETEQKLSVRSVYPADEAGDVYVNSGFEAKFTTAVSPENIGDYFSIEPYIDGKLWVQDKTLYFTPYSGYDYETRYTVTLKKGLPSPDGQTLAEDHICTFVTESDISNGYIYTRSSSSGFSETFIPGDPVCIEISYSHELAKSDPRLETHLYRFDSAEDYRAAIMKHTSMSGSSDMRTDTSAMTEVFTSTEKPFTRGEYSQSSYILLPEDLEVGYYAADISAEGRSGVTAQYLFEITPLSVYAMSLGEENVFFVNSTETGLPAAGAEITIETSGKKYSGTVGSDGLVKIDTNGEKGNAVTDISFSGSRYIDCLMLSDAEDMTYSDRYYMYLYTDRAAYLPTDTINVWGFVIPKTHGDTIPDELTLSLSESESVDIKPRSDGTFTAEFEIKDHATSWGGISLMCGEDELKRAYFTIMDYVKPTYVLSADAPDHVILPSIYPFTVTLGAEYFEGTPAEGVTFEYDTADQGTVTVTTDKDGKAEVSISAPKWEDMSWKPGYYGQDFRLTGVENSYQSIYMSTPAFYRDVMLTYDFNKDTNDLTVRTNKIDFSRAEEFLAQPSSDSPDPSYDILKGDAVPVEVFVTVKHHFSEKIETGSYYDYIEKRTVTEYTYDYNTTQAAAYRFTTDNGSYTLRDLPIISDNGYYEIIMSYNDSHGNSTQESFTVYAKGHEPDYMQYYAYGGVFSAGRGPGNLIYALEPDGRKESDYYYSYGVFSENETVKMKLRCSDPDSQISGKLMLALYRSDFISYQILDVGNNSTVAVEGTRDLIPDARYSGAYFDGKHIYRVYGSFIEFDPSERDIVLEASSDKDSYDAGDTVTITVRASDINGAPMKNAVVNLSLVDEAAFAIEDQNADILGSVYSHIYYPAASDHISYIQHFKDTTVSGEKGGGPGDGLRTNFKDTAYFDTAYTDADGNAVFTITLPDNLTTWRATVQAACGDGEDRLYAGTLTIPVVTTRSVFITPVMQSEFVVGDDIAVSAKCAGLNGGVISVRLTGEGIDKTIDIAPEATANFGKLEKGSYKVMFSASDENGSDAVEMPIEVTDTLLETYLVKGMELSDLDKISPTKFPLRISFFDKEYLFCTDILYGLLNYSGESLDMRMASAYAQEKLGYITHDDVVSAYIGETKDGFARQLPAAAPDNEITALMCAAMPDAVNRRAAREAFRKDLENDPPINDACIDYMGLAALGEPVLGDIRALLESGKVQFPESGIYLSAALALSGDYSGAYDTYMRFVPEIKTDDSDAANITAFIDGTNSQKLTCTALITASVLDLPEAEYFARYLSSDEKKYNNYALQLVIYLENYVPAVKGNAAFSYYLDGKTENVSVERHRPYTIEMTREQFENAKFTVTSGSVYTLVRYIGRITENDSSPTITVTKSLSGEMTPGKTVTVSIKALPNSIVYDVVPSCGRFSRSTKGWCTHEGQLVKIFTDANGSASYTFTVNAAGEFVVESAVTYIYDTEEWGNSGRSSITVS